MGFPAAPLLALLLAPAVAAKGAPAKKEEAWYLVQKDGKEAAVYLETAEESKRDKSITITQAMRHLFPAPARSVMKALSLNDKALTPSWMEVHFKSDDGKNEFSARTSATRKEGLKHMTVTFEQIKPAYQKTVKDFPTPAKSLFFLALPRHLAKLESGFYLGRAIESDVDKAELRTRILKIRRLDEKKDFSGTACFRSAVELSGVDSTFWVSAAGALCEFESPAMRLRVSRTTRERAEKLGAP